MINPNFSARISLYDNNGLDFMDYASRHLNPNVDTEMMQCISFNALIPGKKSTRRLHLYPESHNGLRVLDDSDKEYSFASYVSFQALPIHIKRWIGKLTEKGKVYLIGGNQEKRSYSLQKELAKNCKLLSIPVTSITNQLGGAYCETNYVYTPRLDTFEIFTGNDKPLRQQFKKTILADGDTIE